MTWQQRYEALFALKYPGAYQHSGFPNKMLPNTSKANGLTKAIINVLMWSGYRATRIGSSGRVIHSPQRQISGISLMTARYIPGSTRRGAADISATIRGRSVMLEVKAGKDRPSEYQVREQELERSAGGVYEFIYDMNQFFRWYDQFLLTFK